MSERHDIYADGGRHERERASRQVNISLLIAAGVIGLPLLIGIAQCSSQDNTPAPQVGTNQTYANNSYLPGAGYYHAPFHGWFPLPYNQYDGGRGWYRGGQWSRQSPADDQRSSAGTGVYGGSGSVGGSGTGGVSGFVNSSRPSSEAVSRANHAAADFHASSVTRGGFGRSMRSIFS